MAYQDYLRQEFPDQRGPNLADPAPDDATGIYFDIHSAGDLVMWPWGFPAPLGNAQAFTTFGRKLAFFNGYTPMQITGLGTFDGSTADFGYGELGIAAMAFELGTTFFQSCSYFENNIVPEMLPTLVYASKVARTPFLTPAGPEALHVAVSGAGAPGVLVTLNATIDDTRYNQSNGAEPTQNIAGASYTIDTPPWEASAVAVEMSADDGLFNASSESVSATINTSGLAPGRHTVFVMGRDSSGGEGAVSAAFLDVVDPAADDDSDGVPNITDCALFDSTLWSAPGEPLQLTISGDVLEWNAPTSPGSTVLSYELLRSPDASDFIGAPCAESGIAGTTTVDATTPGSGELLSYLVRSVNGCGRGLAPDSSGAPRPAALCF